MSWRTPARAGITPGSCILPFSRRVPMRLRCRSEITSDTRINAVRAVKDTKIGVIRAFTLQNSRGGVLLTLGFARRQDTEYTLSALASAC